MGGIISRLRQSNDSDYEKILSDLDSNIRKAELRLSAINLRERRLMGIWLIYSVLAWIGYSAVFGLYLHHQHYDDPQMWAIALAPVALGVPLIYMGRSLITVWYKRAKSNEESQLSVLRADQRLKVEELKKKTAYYSTKTLLERYDPSSQNHRSNGARPMGADGRPIPSPQNGQPRPQQPNMMDPGLRHRQGQGAMNAQGIPMGQGRAQNQQQSPAGHGSPNAPRGPQGPYPQQQQPFNPGQPYANAMPPQYGSYSTEKHWYDKIVDVIVGDEGPDTKYALICGRCFAHNGLALPQEIDDIQYVCPKCNFFNASRRKTRLAASGIRPSTPDMTLLRAQEKPLPISRDPSPSPSAHRLPLPEHPMHHPEQPSMVKDSSPEPVADLPLPTERAEHSETDDIELVSNWHDSDVEGADHDEGDDTDNAQGYIVDSDQGKKLDSSASRNTSSATTKAKKTRKAKLV
ncbi:hypothetical protein BG011_005336 [Mortierella polycephala]|uniref:Endoplasmic reticulum junction formation protein lunapark n=1 Tax=Mortierella polycephala TaxID=41804 RepID=A0A9P6PYD0_9FUNG|nr:hypothetical protein BG011_005336 [Mortierella polycephala]